MHLAHCLLAQALKTLTFALGVRVAADSPCRRSHLWKAKNRYLNSRTLSSKQIGRPPRIELHSSNADLLLVVYILAVSLRLERV